MDGSSDVRDSAYLLGIFCGGMASSLSRSIMDRCIPWIFLRLSLINLGILESRTPEPFVALFCTLLLLISLKLVVIMSCC